MLAEVSAGTRPDGAGVEANERGAATSSHPRRVEPSRPSWMREGLRSEEGPASGRHAAAGEPGLTA